MKAPAWASASRPASSRAFHTGHAWIMCGQISSVTGTSAAPAARYAVSKSPVTAARGCLSRWSVAGDKNFGLKRKSLELNLMGTAR